MNETEQRQRQVNEARRNHQMDRPSSQKSKASKYSAVPFSRPIAFEAPAREEEKMDATSQDDYSEDEFEDDFEPYETSHEGKEEEVTERGKTDGHSIPTDNRPAR